MLTDLMQPEDEARNEHKRMQLRELAALNGTLKVRFQSDTRKRRCKTRKCFTCDLSCRSACLPPCLP